MVYHVVGDQYNKRINYWIDLTNPLNNIFGKMNSKIYILFEAKNRFSDLQH